jgi:hypothetical protein
MEIYVFAAVALGIVVALYYWRFVASHSRDLVVSGEFRETKTSLLDRYCGAARACVCRVCVSCAMFGSCVCCVMSIAHSFCLCSLCA